MNLLIVFVIFLLSLSFFILFNYLDDAKLNKIDSILLPNVIMIILSSIFTKLKNYMILFIIFYLIIDYIYIFIISKREFLINNKTYYFNTFITLIIGIIIYQFFLLKVKYSYVDMEVFKNFIWVMIIFYFYNKLNLKAIKTIKEDEDNFDKIFNEFVIVNYAKYKNKYSYLIKSNSDIEDLIYSFMIYENYLKNKNIVTLIKSYFDKKYGVMNIYNDTKITDEESIVIVKEKLESKLKKLRNNNKIESLIKDNYRSKDVNDIEKIFNIIKNFNN